MIKNAALRIVSKQISKGNLKEEDREFYQYGYELLINEAINIVFAIIIMLLFSSWLPVLLFIICYVPLRIRAGGHHANSHEGCIAVTATALCIISLVYPTINSLNTSLVQIIMMVLSGSVILILAPVDDINKPATEKELIYFRKKARIVWFVEVVGWGLAIWKFPQISLIIAMAHGTMAVVLWLGAVKLKKEKQKLQSASD